MKIFVASFLLLSAPTTAQTLEQRADKIIVDANLAENAMQRVVAEASRLKADIAKSVLNVGSPPLTPPVVDAPHHGSLLPFIDVAKIPSPSVGFAGARVRVDFPHHEKPTPMTDGSGQFRITCDFSHMNFDDAIVYPGRKGASHLHTYFGNTKADYSSTKDSIESTGNSTCTGGTANRTGYWVPAIIDTKDGTPLKPITMMVYYKSDIGANAKPFPEGLRIVSGDMRATGPQQRVWWDCYGPDGKNVRSSTIPANCNVGGIIEMTIEFPSCWDGVNLDSPNHKSHMAIPVQNTCPASHPVQLPHITEKVRYAVTEAGSTSRWRLSSDNYSKDKPGGYSIHADWFNGWDAKVQEKWVKNCLQATKDCHTNLLGDGTAIF